MRALLLIAHGSRRPASNEEVRALARRVAVEVGDEFPIVECSFLELAEPDLATTIDRCIERGASSVAVVPYFLAAGTHVVNDIPAIIDVARHDNPAVTITLAEHIGASSLMVGLIRQCATP